MKEDVLQYCWQFQKYNTTKLYTTEGELVEVLKPGHLNVFDGPDFLNAHLIIGGVEWFGHVEIHKSSSDWNAHNHSRNKKYQNVILHVVQKHDCEIKYVDEKIIPTLETSELLSEKVLKTVEVLQQSKRVIPCQSLLNKVPVLIRNMQLDAALVYRYELKAEELKDVFQESNVDLNETLYRSILLSLGFSVNKAGMMRLGGVLSYKTLCKHSSSEKELRVLLLGVAGLLSEEEERKQFELLAHKYELTDRVMTRESWVYGGVRPPNFPEKRLSQLVRFIYRFQDLVGLLKQPDQLNDWLYADERKTGFNRATKKHLLINSLLPAYTLVEELQKAEEKSISLLTLLEGLTAESNKYTRAMESVGFLNNSAKDSQALLGQKKLYCDLNQCLKCKIGASLIG